jgi:hypothetical protein
MEREERKVAGSSQLAAQIRKSQRVSECPDRAESRVAESQLVDLSIREDIGSPALGNFSLTMPIFTGKKEAS